MSLYLQFFLSGLALGAGVCGAHCVVLVAPLAAGSGGWKGGARTGLLFGAGKVLVYGILGAAASYSGYIVQDFIAGRAAALAGGAAFTAMGFWFFFRRGDCPGKLSRSGPPFLLGLIEGAFPCGVTLGLVLYIAFLGGSAPFGMLAGALFGTGSTVFPLVLVCGAAPYLWRRVERRRKAFLALRIAGSGIFFLWGLTLFLRLM